MVSTMITSLLLLSVMAIYYANAEEPVSIDDDNNGKVDVGSYER